jgi:hypothetical protein
MGPNQTRFAMNISTVVTPDTTPVAPPASTSPAAGSGVASNAKVAILFLSADTDARLIVAVGVILQSMAGNAAYPSPLPTLATATTAYDTYVAAVNAAKDRGKLAIARRKQARAQLVQLLRALALYVQQTCDGNAVTLITSGFLAQRGRGRPVGVLSAPLNVRLRPGPVSGQILARCNKVDSALTYQWRYAPALTPTAWTQADAVLKASFTVQGLAPGTVYIAQARVIGTNGPSNWSDSATLMSM